MDSFLANTANLMAIVAYLSPFLSHMRRYIRDTEHHRESKRRRLCFSNTEDHNGALQPNQQRFNWFKDAWDSIDAWIEAFSPKRVVTLPHDVLESGISKQTLKKIWDSLHDDQNYIIGLCGLAGIGKTTLLKAINNHLVGTKRYEIVFFVTVGSGESFQLEIQKQMMKRLNLKFDENNDPESRSVLLNEALSGKRYLLLLDNVLQDFSLDNVGIQISNKGNGSKVVIAALSAEVLSWMRADLVIKVEPLTQSEGLELLAHRAGEVARMPDIQALAMSVMNECNGIPIAITVVGAALRGKKENVLWRNALRALKESTISEIAGMEPKVFQALKLSFNHLDDKIKEHFLYCSLIPKGCRIDVYQLTWYWRAESLVDNASNFAIALDKTHVIIDRIKDACLLCSTMIMHNLVHDMVVWITSSSTSSNISKHMVRTWAALKEPPPNELWKGNKRISLEGNEITRLSSKPNCPDLVTLFLCFNPLIFVHERYFDAMPKLTTLDLSQTRIESLPESIGSLLNLQVLKLSRCFHLRDIQHLVKLSSLIFLDLSRSRVSGFPPGMENLSLLLSLNLSNMLEIFTISCKVISAFVRMEELFLNDTKINWLRQDQDNTFITALDEVASLKYLRRLYINIEHIGWVRESFFYNLSLTLERFLIKIGLESHEKKLSHVMHYLPFVICHKFVDVDGLGSCVNGVKVMATQAEVVILERIGEKHASEVVGDSKSLAYLEISNCAEMESIMNLGEIECYDALQNLEYMHLYRLPRLKTIFEGDAPVKMKKLEKIIIRGCNNLKFLFTLEMAKHLDHLNHLDVRDCNELESLITQNENILDCTEMESVINSGEIECDDALQNHWHMHLYDLPRLKTIFEGDAPVKMMKKLESLLIDGCNNLKFLFTLEMAKHLDHLRSLSVSDCNELEGLIPGNELSPQHCALPKLEDLELENLPNIRLQHSPYIPNLETLELSSIPNSSRVEYLQHLPNLTSLTLSLSNLSDLEYLQDLPNLRELDLSCLPDLTEALIAGNELSRPHCALPKLQDLQLGDLPNISLQCLLHLQNLEELALSSIPNLSDVEYLQRLSNLTKLKLLFLPNLSDLKYLQDLPNLTDLFLKHLPNLTDTVLNCSPNLIDLKLFDLPNLKDVYTVRAKGLRYINLHRLPKLENIFKGDTSAKQGPYRLTVSECDNLKNIFPSESLVKSIQNLCVDDCKGLEDIVAGGVLMQQHILLPKLSNLSLRRLPKLRSIIKCAELTLPSIERFDEDECPNLILPTCTDLAKLRKRRCEREDFLHPTNWV